ncbi:MAG: response regulator [Methanoregula sp.]|jgi:CheY-like chemotaxis protein
MDTVLIVDDSSFIVEGLIAFLKKKYIPLAAHGGGECLEILRRETPSVIILDIMMEPMDGWETLSHIKENPKTRNIPVLMFSALKISPAEAEEHQISIDDCLTKPVSPNTIIEAIEKVLARRDTNLMVVERWQSAGISQQKIDEYLSLATSLEVDLSLCQNMKIQYDLGHPDDKNLDEFEVVISAIGDRILQERDQIERLARELNDIVVQEAGREWSAEIKKPQIADGPVNQYEGSGTRDDNPRALAPEVTPPETPIPDATVTGSGNLRNTDPDPAGTTAPESTPLTITAPGHPEHDMPQTNSGPDLQVSGERFGNPVSPVPEPAEIAPAGVPLIPADTGAAEPVSPSPEREHGNDDSAREIVPQPAPLPVSPVISPAPFSVQDLPVPGERNVIPADPDVRQTPSRTSPVTGAGTDVPMPWNFLPDRNPQRIITEMKGKNMIPTPEPVSPPRGIFARIIAIVRSVFGQGK